MTSDSTVSQERSRSSADATCRAGVGAGADAGSSLVRPPLLLSSPTLECAWVTQPSPCCAAAALAGALNAVSPASDQRWTCERALWYLQRVVRARLERQTRRLQRLGGVFPWLQHGDQGLGALETAVCDALSSTYGLPLGGEKKLSKQILRVVVAEQVAALRAAAVGAREGPEPATFCPSADRTTAWEATSQEVAVGLRSVAFDVAVAGEQSHETRESKLVGELAEYFRLLYGLARLERRDRPSTSSCGNDTVLEAVKLVSADDPAVQVLAHDGGALRASLLLGVAWTPSSASSSGQQGVTFAVSREDSRARRREGWRVLCAAFSRSQTALIYHMKNHYALVFALRQRNVQGAESEAEGGDVCELLTARQGQRPRAWVDWREVYETLCSWRGYAVLAVSTA